MNEHVNPWLEAYYDGELSGRRMTVVSRHLETCQICREELEHLSALSQLLRESPPADARTRPDLFVAQVKLRLPRRQLTPVWQRGLIIAWQLVPLALLIAWLGVKTAHITANFLSGMYLFDLGSDQLSSVMEGAGSILQSNLWMVDLLGFNLIINLVAPFSIGLLYLSWITGWWVSQRTNKLDNTAS